jgi:hypothetical protein
MDPVPGDLPEGSERMQALSAIRATPAIAFVLGEGGWEKKETPLWWYRSPALPPSSTNVEQLVNA